jgi:hypothetical protein
LDSILSLLLSEWKENCKVGDQEQGFCFENGRHDFLRFLITFQLLSVSVESWLYLSELDVRCCLSGVSCPVLTVQEDCRVSLSVVDVVFGCWLSVVGRWLIIAFVGCHSVFPLLVASSDFGTF